MTLPLATWFTLAMFTKEALRRRMLDDSSLNLKLAESSNISTNYSLVCRGIGGEGACLQNVGNPALQGSLF